MTRPVAIFTAALFSFTIWAAITDYDPTAWQRESPAAPISGLNTTMAPIGPRDGHGQLVKEKETATTAYLRVDLQIDPPVFAHLTERGISLSAWTVEYEHSVTLRGMPLSEQRDGWMLLPLTKSCTSRLHGEVRMSRVVVCPPRKLGVPGGCAVPRLGIRPLFDGVPEGVVTCN